MESIVGGCRSWEYRSHGSSRGRGHIASVVNRESPAHQKMVTIKSLMKAGISLGNRDTVLTCFEDVTEADIAGLLLHNGFGDCGKDFPLHPGGVCRR